MEQSFNLQLRSLTEADGQIIHEAFAAQGWNKPLSLYENYLILQEKGDQDIIIATINGIFAGYLTILWSPNYLPFKERGIPEIQDFNVLKKFRRQGIGTALMNEAEQRVKKASPLCGIGFGLTPDYGAAQILYVKRGYIPDGNGLTCNGRSLDYGEHVTVNDDLAFYLIKAL